MYQMYYIIIQILNLVNLQSSGLAPHCSGRSWSCSCSAVQCSVAQRSAAQWDPKVRNTFDVTSMRGSENNEALVALDFRRCHLTLFGVKKALPVLAWKLKVVMQCSAVKCSAVQCSEAQRSAVHHSGCKSSGLKIDYRNPPLIETHPFVRLFRISPPNSQGSLTWITLRPLLTPCFKC